MFIIRKIIGTLATIMLLLVLPVSVYAPNENNYRHTTSLISRGDGRNIIQRSNALDENAIRANSSSEEGTIKANNVLNEKASKINKILGGALKNKGNVIVQLCEKYNVNPYVVASIMIHETENGRSSAVVDKNNPGGMVDDNGKIIVKETLDKGIESMIKNLKVNYIDYGLDSIEAIQPKYAPVGADNDPDGLNKCWLSKVQYYYELIQNQ